MTIDQLRERLDELNAQALQVKDKAQAEDRDLTADEQKTLEEIFARFDDTEKQIEQLEKIENISLKLAEGRGRKTEPNDPQARAQFNNSEDDDPPGYRQRRVPREPINPEEKGKFGFRNFGDFAKSVKMAAVGGGYEDPRLLKIKAAAATTYGSEGVGGDGGFAVPPDFRRNIVEKVMGEDTLISRTDDQVSSSNTFTFPVDETTPWQTSGGIQAYWEGEASAMTQSKPSLQNRSLRLHKLTALVPVTEELLEDAPSLDGYLRRKAPEKIDFKINLALVQGTGAGQPLGLLNAPAAITVSKESSQGADTLQFANIINMWSRLDRSCRGNAVWLIHQDIEPQLYSMQFPGTGTAVPVYLPPGGLSQSPYGTLMGRPVIPTEACETLGDKGDIVLTDFSKYLTVTRGGGVRVDTSMHLWFDQDLTAFKFTMRLAGAPWWAAPISPRDGANTRSCIVTLAERG